MPDIYNKEPFLAKEIRENITMNSLSRPRRESWFRWVAVLLLVPAFSFADPSVPEPLPPLSDRQRALHLLNRLTFGPRLSDLKHLSDVGIDEFIREQLHPETLNDSACEDELKKYPVLTQSSRQLFQAYPRPKAAAREGRAGLEGPREVMKQLSQAKLIRLVRSERQLQELMVDFWFNHFNVSADKGPEPWLIVPYERDVIRPHALGRFRDLLGAVAKSPAMLIYLDNALSTVDARYAPAEELADIEKMEKRMSNRQAKRKKLGLNENYARELLELHTLGVDGGYTQKDVTELARVLTGWSIDRPGPQHPDQDWEFKFRPRMHDGGDKVVLGHSYGHGGIEEGEQVLDMLARHPSTARFIARKLCRRFVSDDPPEALIDRVSQRFLETDGDIRETLLAIFQSPEFFSPGNFRAKIKPPLEFIVSSLRVTEARIIDPLKIVGILNAMGEPLYLCQPPTGYPDRAQDWVNSGALLQRMQFALMLLRSDVKSPAVVDVNEVVPEDGSHNGEEILSRFFYLFLGGEVSASTRNVLADRLKDPEITEAVLDDPKKVFHARKLGALVLGSPDFQRR